MELIRAYHWNFLKSHQAFGYSLDHYLSFGGYPGANPFKHDVNRWLDFIKNLSWRQSLKNDISRLRRIARPPIYASF